MAYIEREAAIEVIMNEPPDAHYPQWYADKIKGISAADVVTVRHGRWLDGKCTVCGWEEPDVCTWLGYDAEAWIETPYCPNCGAIMDGDRL